MILYVAITGVTCVIAGMVLLFSFAILMGIWEKSLGIKTIPRTSAELDIYTINKKKFDKIWNFILKIVTFLIAGGTLLTIASGFVIGILKGEWYAIVAITAFIIFAYGKIKKNGISGTLFDIRNWISK